MCYTMTEDFYEKKAGNGCVAELLFYGRINRRQLEFLAGSVKKYKINKTTLNRYGSVVVWNLRREVLRDFLAEAGEAGIEYRGAYDPKRIHVFCAPLSGIAEGECFDVYPYADAARRWLEGRVGQDAAKEKSFGGAFTVRFSNVPWAMSERKACDMAFCATEGGLFEVWAGNLASEGCGQDPGQAGYSCQEETPGAEPALFRLAEKTEAGRFLSYIEAGFAIRGQAHTADDYRSLFWKAMAALPDAKRQSVTVETAEITKTGNGNFTCGPRVVKQKQKDLYAVRYHPLGGVVNVAFWQKLLRSLENAEDVELRLDPRMDIYVCNLLAEEVGLPMDSMADGAFTAAEASPVQALCGLCSRANCEAQMFEHVLLKETKKLGFADGVLPAFTVAGCPDACGGFSDVDLRFLAEARKAGETGWFLVEAGDGFGGWHSMGRIPQQQLTEYLIALGALSQSAGLSFREWRLSDPGLMEKVTALYTVEEYKLSSPKGEHR